MCAFTPLRFLQNCVINWSNGVAFIVWLKNFTGISCCVKYDIDTTVFNFVALLEMKYLHLVWCKKKKKKRFHAARVFQMITSLMARKSESYWFGFIPVKYLYVHTCVLAVITYRKIDKKQRVNKVKCVVKQIKQTFPQRLGLVCLKVKP